MLIFCISVSREKNIFDPVNLYYNKAIKEIAIFQRWRLRLRNAKGRQRGVDTPIETNRNCTIFNRRFASRFPSEATKSWWLVRTRGSPHVSRGHLLTPLKIPDETSR